LALRFYLRFNPRRRAGATSTGADIVVLPYRRRPLGFCSSTPRWPRQALLVTDVGGLGELAPPKKKKKKKSAGKKKKHQAEGRAPKKRGRIAA